MQPVQAQTESPTRSQLLDSLKVYLSNKKRLQPIIGLGGIIECVSAGAHDREVLYLCEVCVCRLSKADIRTHIMGSLHRYNYIKVWHPDLVSKWEENIDLSKLAWPLMEIAKTIEQKEGHGDVQFVEVEDAAYQTMSAFSDYEAVTLIHILISGHAQVEPDDQSEASPVQLEPIQSQRSVFLSRDQQGWSDDTSASLLENTHTSPEPPVLSENSSSFFDGHAGTEPLIGLFHVVECRSEEGHTYCFLCHCCRIRSNKEDIIDHLTSSAHLMNYLMETCPEQVEVMTADVHEDYQLLQSLARRVEQEEGRGELEVINTPESLCVQLTGKSYHWCIRMLSKGWTNTDTLKRKISEEGPKVNRETPASGATVAQTKMRKRSNTVFKVSLPASKGSLLLERTSCSVDSDPVSSTYSPAPDSDLVSSFESWSEEYELDCDDTLGPERNISVNLYQDRKGYFSDTESFNPSGHLTGTMDPNFYGESDYNGQHDYQEGSSEGFYKEWQNEVPQTQTEGLLLPAVCHYQDWGFCNSFYGVEGWY
uniref:uncharacterized protein isoform X2 n=1 Tax=Semicossyphus pulcher TaxID=241346 RepID=UPI0037E857A7